MEDAEFLAISFCRIKLSPCAEFASIGTMASILDVLIGADEVQNGCEALVVDVTSVCIAEVVDRCWSLKSGRYAWNNQVPYKNTPIVRKMVAKKWKKNSIRPIVQHKLREK